MSLFDQLGGQQPMNPQQMLAEIKARPANVLSRSGFSVPAGMNDPQQIVQHLLQSGQVGNDRLQQIMRLIPRR